MPSARWIQRFKFTTMRSALILSSYFRPATPMYTLSFSIFFRQNLYAIDFVPLSTRFCFRRRKTNTQQQDFQLSLQYISFGVTCPTQWNTSTAFSEAFARESFQFYTFYKVILHSFNTSQFPCSVSCHCLPSVQNRCYGNESSDRLQWNMQAHLGLCASHSFIPNTSGY